MTIDPIGIFRGRAVRRYEAPRQGVFDGGEGSIELLPGHDFETALRDLDGFERIWVIFAFHRNDAHWRTTVRPPVAPAGRKRVGVFASRAPYRPNALGLSCLRLLRVSGRVLDVAEADLLDGTPVFDIKPYVPRADSFPGVRAGWVDEQAQDAWRVTTTPAFEAAVSCVCAAGAPDVRQAAYIQLSHAPFDTARKRVVRTPEGGILSLRMFRLAFAADPDSRTLTLTRLFSGYTPQELTEPDDPYADKVFHRALCAAEGCAHPADRPQGSFS